MIVVDVNTLAYLWIPGEFTEWAEQALERDPHWVAPILWRSEFRNILSGYLRREQISRSIVDRCLASAERQLYGYEYIVPSERVMQAVDDSSCSAYDCEYVALAEDLNVPLVTSDKKIIKEFPLRAVSLTKFAGGTELPQW